MRALLKSLCAGMGAIAFAAAAQLSPPDPDWKEIDTPPPPAFDVSRLIAFDVSTGLALSFGVDPATISIGRDGVVRYVVVARSNSGAMNAMYEGLRCSSGEFKTYARYNPSGGWNRLSEPGWKSLWAAQTSQHTLRFARQGGCMDKAPPITVAQIVRDLKNQDYQKLR